MVVDEKTKQELTKNIVFLNDITWADYIYNDKITILNFLSSVDLVSRQQIPLVRELAAEYGDKFTVGVLDAGLCPSACNSCDIKGLPSMVVMRKGVILGVYRGHMHKEDFPELILQFNTWQQMDMEKAINI